MSISATFIIYETSDARKNGYWILPEFKGKFKWTNVPKDVNTPTAEDLVSKLHNLFSEVCTIPFDTDYDGEHRNANMFVPLSIPAEVMIRHPNIVAVHEFTITTHRPQPNTLLDENL